MDCLSNPQCQNIADKSVKKVFAILGVDIDDPQQVEEFREDLRFGKSPCLPIVLPATSLADSG